MTAILKPSAEYNRRVAIIEGLRVGRSATEIIRFFGYPRSFMTLCHNKIYGFRTVQWRFQYASEEESQGNRILMDVVKPWMETVASGRPYVFDNVDVLVQGILASQQLRFKSLGLLRMELKGPQTSLGIPM
ncbi:hypothetical protein ALC53_00212 [Atta colombica]|uniref:Uncharacterized protein n=1 Tax=Atta colombica TaxID=520822 RepID=A0A195BZC2_9HYME|nr:hypothetical protein ALC53_00212 [Atta colombica]